MTAVYILRAVGQTVMGPVTDSHYLGLKDAEWNEKFAAGILILGIVVIGIAPFLLNNLLTPATNIIMQHAEKLVTIK
ncbi:MAG TPA: hypothetical protein PL045_03195 [Chitinophagaceae bacterium]|nr:hypothetical protein [Chitinophagaceae bacterium]